MHLAHLARGVQLAVEAPRECHLLLVVELVVVDEDDVVELLVVEEEVVEEDVVEEDVVDELLVVELELVELELVVETVVPVVLVVVGCGPLPIHVTIPPVIVKYVPMLIGGVAGGPDVSALSTISGSGLELPIQR